MLRMTRAQGPARAPLETFILLRHNKHLLHSHYHAPYDEGTGACPCPPETFILLKQNKHLLQNHHEDGRG